MQRRPDHPLRLHRGAGLAGPQIRLSYVLKGPAGVVADG
jgi:hypothetical protein